MPEYFDCDIPFARRTPKDLRIHRVVRRDVWPDYISKQVVHNETYRCIYSYLDYAGSVDPEMLSTSPKFPAMEVPDPFGLHTFHMKYSLNKKYRFELDEELSERIINYQDDTRCLKRSYLRTITADTGWKFRYGGYVKRNKVHTVEFATVKNGEFIHKYANHANRYDFIKKQAEPRKGKKTRWSRNEIEYRPNMEWSAEIQLHVLYKTTTNGWDRRVRNKCDKKVAHEKKESRKGFIKKCDDAKVILYEDIYEEDEFEDMGDDKEECLQSLLTQNHERSAVTTFVVSRTHRNERRRSNKKNRPNFTKAYEDWLYSAPEERPKSAFVSRSTSEDSSGYETVQEINEDIISGVPELHILPSVIIPIPTMTTLRNYVLNRFPSADCLERLQPETFLVEVNSDIIPETSISTEFNGFISIRMNSNNSEKDLPFVRWTFNSVTELWNKSDSTGKPSSNNIALWCSTTKILPPSAFSVSDCFNEDVMRKQLVKEWLITSNTEMAVDEEVTSTSSNLCEVCFGDQEDGFALLCGHYFCATCWALNAQQCISAGVVPIRCMSPGCAAVLELDHALTLIPYEEYVRYEKALWNKLVLQQGWMYCNDCGCVMRPKPSSSKSCSAALCNCGAAKCITCKNAFHAPMPCDIAEQYCEILRSNGEEMERALCRQSLMLRRCPRCRSCCERTEGCNHMECRCGFQFCYACGKQFDGSHYDCEKIVLQRVHLFDVHGRGTDEIVQAIYEDSWEYREQRMPQAVARLRKKLNKISSGLDAFADTYIAAMEVLEFGEVTLQFLKRPYTVTGQHLSKSRRSKRVDRFNWISNCILRLKFVVERFRLAIDTNATKTRMERLSALVKASARDLILNQGAI